VSGNRRFRSFCPCRSHSRHCLAEAGIPAARLFEILYGRPQSGEFFSSPERIWSHRQRVLVSKYPAGPLLHF
jgi:hypothetical protein